jgi:large subunit ribosomal protein L3
MPPGLMVRKVGMTQIFDANGTISPVTILKAGLCQITRVKITARDGFDGVQIGYNEEKVENLNKPKRGFLKKIVSEGFKSLGEFRVSDPQKYKLGQLLNVDLFKKGEKVRIVGTSIGKGFAGNQKRNNFSRGPMTHGSKNHRLPGSIGAGSTPGRVYPGKKMAGHLGNRTVTLTKVEIVYVNSEANILVIKGSVPGKNNAILRIQHKRST